MAEEKIGTAKDAAELLGLSLSQFNEQRLAGTYEYDPVDGSLVPLPDRDDMGPDSSLRSYMKSRHLVAPAFAGQSRPGGSWEFNLDRLRLYREQGPPGATYRGSRPRGE